MGQSQSSVDLETRTKTPSTFSKVIVSVMMGGTFVTLMYFGHLGRQQMKHDEEVRKYYLAPNAISIKINDQRYRLRDFGVIIGVPKDVNGDGIYESVMKFVNPITREIESRIIERDGDQVKIRKYEVVNGQIKYLPE